MKHFGKTAMAVTMIVSMALVSGCATSGGGNGGLGGLLGEKGSSQRSDTVKGTAGGAAAGALLGQILGHSTKSTILGAGLGAILGGGIGHHVGHEKDQNTAIAGNANAVQGEAAARNDADAQQAKAILQATLDNGVIFDKGSATLTTDASQRLAILAQAMNEAPDAKLTLTGHASSEGPADVNAKLANDRAQAVFNGLTALGINPARMTVTSMGAAQPVSTSPDALAMSRRVTFTVA